MNWTHRSTSTIRTFQGGIAWHRQFLCIYHLLFFSPSVMSPRLHHLFFFFILLPRHAISVFGSFLFSLNEPHDNLILMALLSCTALMHKQLVRLSGCHNIRIRVDWALIFSC